jgi:DNA-binding MarR family transcriptional regulator
MPASGPSVDDIQHVAAFRVALRRFFRQTELAARASELTPRQYLLLLLVKGAPNGSETANIGELAHRLHLAQSTVTELVSRAVDSGLVTASAAAADGRVTEIHLTNEGERRLAECFWTLDQERKVLQEALAEIDIGVGL